MGKLCAILKIKMLQMPARQTVNYLDNNSCVKIALIMINFSLEVQLTV